MSRFILLLLLTSLLSGGLLAKNISDRSISKKDTQAYDLEFSTYFGGSKYDEIRDITVDELGNIYIAGGSLSANFPRVGKSQIQSFGDSMDVAVAKFNPDGKLIWSTVFGGPNYDRAYAIELDEKGNIYIAGRSGDGFPTTSGVIQEKFGGDSNPNKIYGLQDGFVTKLSPDGSQLIWSTYFGGNDRSIIRDIDVDAVGDVYLAMYQAAVRNPHIPSTAFQPKPTGRSTGVIAKISADGKKTIWGTYLGGKGPNGLLEPSIRVDSQGAVYVMGGTGSGNMPVSGDAFDRKLNGKLDMYLAKFSAEGEFVFGTYLGGSGTENTETHSLALDEKENPVIAAVSNSTDFPVTKNSFQAKFGSSNDPKNSGDSFITKLSTDGSKLLASTYLGGSSNDLIQGVNIGPSGNIYISGETNSENLTVSMNALQTRKAGAKDCFIFILSPDLTKINYGSYFGGSRDDRCASNTIDSFGHFIFGGDTASSDFPLQNAIQENFAGGAQDDFIAKLQILP